MAGFVVRGGGAEIAIDVAPPASRQHDEPGMRWRSASVTATLGQFHIRMIHLDMRVEDLETFVAELRPLYNTLIGTATLAATEGWIFLEIEGAGSGRLDAHGELVDRSTGDDGNRLAFTVPGYDQTYLPDLIAELNVTIAAVR